MEPVRGPANDYFMPTSGDAHRSPRFLADIGGTSLRFALEQESGRLEAIFVRPLHDFSSISHAIATYLAQPQAIAAGAKNVCLAACAIANPIDGDAVKMTNADWSFSIEAVRQQFGFDKLLMLNDFTALAMAIPRLTAEDVRQVGGGQSQRDAVIGVIGPGTGLGVSGLIPAGETWLPLSAEGGHVSFAPADEKEVDILRFAWRDHPHVSAERLLSGMGIELIYRAVAGRLGVTAEKIATPEIAQRALSHACVVCDETIDLFCAMLGTVAGNLALTLGAKGGIYIGGGIVPRLGNRFDQSRFRQRFEAKGRFASYLAAIPTFVITAEYPAFLGVSAMLEKS